MDTIAQKPKRPLWLFPVTVAAAILSLLFPPLYLVLPALIAATLLYDGRRGMFLLLAIPCYGFALLFYGDSGSAALISALCLTSIGYIGGIALQYLQKKKNSGFHTAAVTAAISIAALYLASCLDGILTGEGAFAATKLYAETVSAELLAMLEASPLPEAKTFLETYAPFFEDFDETVILLLVPTLCTVGCVLGVSNTLFLRLFVRRDRKALGLQRIRPLHEWSIPREYGMGITVMLIGSMILMFMDTEFSDAVSTTVITLVSFPLTVQAIAFIDWLIVRKGTRIAFKRTLMAILIIGMFNMISNILVTLGVFEHIFHARERFTAMGMGPKPPQPKQEDKS